LTNIRWGGKGRGSGRGERFGGKRRYRAPDGLSFWFQRKPFNKLIVSMFTECMIIKFKLILEPSDEGGFTVYVPSLPGCISEGDNEEEALENIKEAIELYIVPI